MISIPQNLIILWNLDVGNLFQFTFLIGFRPLHSRSMFRVVLSKK